MDLLRVLLAFFSLDGIDLDPQVLALKAGIDSEHTRPADQFLEPLLFLGKRELRIELALSRRL